MEVSKNLYWAFQSSQTLNPTEEEKKVFQRKYKKDFEQRILFEGDELEDRFRLSGWKNPMFSVITSIIIAFEHEGTMRVKYVEGEEKDLLQNFSNLLKSSFQDYTLVHFDSGIVLPYLGVRLNKNGIINPPHIGLKYFNERPWSLKGSVDLKQYYKGAGDYSFSLEDMCYIFNINSDEIIPYEDEFTYFNSKEQEKLKKSAIRKVEVMCEIYRTLQGLPKLETVLVEEKVKDVVEEKPTDWLRELYNQNKMTPEVIEGLKQQIFGGKKKPTKKEKEHLFTILRGAYVRTNFENNDQDAKKVIEVKEKEINDLLEL